ncbi:response regulator [Chondrinema litorale]|uniref:response regulator n=1 Tax=Chondrinema litorale TaxID=2994555 RepID=UPI002543595F|nr:response regulator [Chondrinema litorale]UZR96954.1 response regulator [Chondrinema litorale]
MQYSEIKKIVLLDDSESDRIYIERVLKKNNIEAEVISCDNAKSFYNILNECTPDIIISDFYLPGFYGSEALFMSKKLHPTVPFILISGKIKPEYLKESELAYADSYLLKDNLEYLPYIIQNAQKRCLDEC